MNDMDQIKRGFRELDLLPDSRAECSFGASEGYYRAYLSYGPLTRLFSQTEAGRWQNVIAMNARKYVLGAQSFGRVLTPRALCCATAFTLAGCLLDRMIDDGTTEERNRGLTILDGISNRDPSRFRTSGACLAEDLLFEVCALIESMRGRDEQSYRALKTGLQRAARSEAAAAEENCELSSIREKSELFVLLGFELAACGQLSPEEKRLYGLIGTSMRLVDDLCDLEEDRRCSRANSILCQEMELQDAIEEAFDLLGSVLQTLREGLSEPFYQFILWELSEWTRDFFEK